MYDARLALLAIDVNAAPIMVCLLVTVAAAFLYFAIALRIAWKQEVYVVPFVGSAVFLCHDLSFVLMYDKWFNVYDHWWVKMWWFALVGTVILEVVMIAQVYRYGHKELWPQLSKGAFGALLGLGTMGIGAMWWLVKAAIGDELFFVTFMITASFSVPLHTAIMSRRQTRAGQSIVMELSTIVMLWCLWGAFSRVAPFFRSTPILAFLAAFTLWPLANVALILRLPRLAGADRSGVSAGSPSGARAGVPIPG